jgi:hypothetical protein
MKDYTITEFTKLVNKLCQLSSNINYYLLEEEFKNFQEWLSYKHRIELNDDFDIHIDFLLDNEIINIKDHIYLSLRQSEKIINQLNNKINL